MSDNMNNNKKIIYSDEDLKALKKTLKEVKKLNFNQYILFFYYYSY